MSKLGIFSWFSYPMPIEKRLSLIRQVGFDAVSLWWGADDRDTQPDIARKIGLEIDNIHAPFKNANDIWLDNINGDEYLNALSSNVEDCYKYNISTVVIHLSGFSNEPAVSNIGFNRIKKLVDIAEYRNINLAFENLHTLHHLDYIFDEIQSKRVGFCYDTGHENCYHPAEDCLSRYGNRLSSIHIDDNFGDGDTHLLPFDGNVNWNKVCEQLNKNKPIEYLTLEVDFNTNHKYSSIYKGLSAFEFLTLAYKKLQTFSDKIHQMK